MRGFIARPVVRHQHTAATPKHRTQAPSNFPIAKIAQMIIIASIVLLMFVPLTQDSFVEEIFLFQLVAKLVNVHRLLDLLHALTAPLGTIAQIQQ